MYKKNKHLYLTSMVIINNTIVDIIATIFIKHLPLAPMSLESTSELPPLYTAESSKVPLCDPILKRPVSLFT